MSIELKIKSKHLALEPAIIRKEERKLLDQLKWYKQHHQITDIYRDEGAYKIHRKYYELSTHRMWNVRNEARATYLARAYLAGKPYKSIEAKTDLWFLIRHIQPRIVDMVAKYGPTPLRRYYSKDVRGEYKPEEIAALKATISEWLNKE